MEEEFSRSSLSENDDYENSQDVDNGEDDEATIAEEELLEGGNYADELRDLEDEGEMSIEDLRRMYGYPPVTEPEGVVDGEDEVDGEEEEETEIEDSDGTERNDTLRTAFQCIDAPIFGEGGNSLSGMDDDDDDYCPPDPWRKHARVDQEKYQAEIPSLLSEEERANTLESAIQDGSVCLWSPDESGATSGPILTEYLQDIAKFRASQAKHDLNNSMPSDSGNGTSQHYRDDEDALYALMQNEYNIEKAKKSLPFPKVTSSFRTVPKDALEWNPEEELMFENEVHAYGKNFPLIKRLKYPNRTVGELVQFYYKWKLTSRYQDWRKKHLATAQNSSRTTQSASDENVGLPPINHVLDGQVHNISTNQLKQ